MTGFFGLLLLILGSLLGASGFIMKKSPESKEMFNKLIPFQGIIGIIMLVWGIIDLFRGFEAIQFLFEFSFFWGLVFLLYLVVMIVLGFLLGYGLLSQYLLSKNADAQEKADAVKDKLITYQTPLGFIGLCIAILFLLVELGIVTPFSLY